MPQNDTQYLTLRNMVDSPQWITEQLLKIAYRNVPLSLSASVVCAFVTVLLLWPVVDNRSLIAWLGCICIKTMLTLTLQQKFENGSFRREHTKHWHKAFNISSCFAGCLWGSVSIFLFPESSAAHQGYLGFVIAGVCAGAITVYSSLPGAFPAFAVCALVPVIVRFIYIGGTEGFMMALLVTTFLLILVRSAWESRKNVKSLLDLQVRNAELTKALHHRATHDSLVDLANHGEFNRQLNRLATSSRRDSTDYSLIFIDLDLFKEVNDSGGHAAGDLILKGVAKILKQRSRAGDTAARVGGDEFALLLDSCGKDRAVEIAEDIRQDIEKLVVEYEGEAYSVKASIGVAYGRTNKHSPTSMLKSADVACYMAKEDGRNQVRSNPANEMFQTTDRFQLSQAIDIA